MTREEFEKEVEAIRELMLRFYFIRDRQAKKKFRNIILDYTKQLLKV